MLRTLVQPLSFHLEFTCRASLRARSRIEGCGNDYYVSGQTHHLTDADTRSREVKVGQGIAVREVHDRLQDRYLNYKGRYLNNFETDRPSIETTIGLGVQYKPCRHPNITTHSKMLSVPIICLDSVSVNLGHSFDHVHNAADRD